jgi:hypothetical protein
VQPCAEWPHRHSPFAIRLGLHQKSVLSAFWKRITHKMKLSKRSKILGVSTLAIVLIILLVLALGGGYGFGGGYAYGPGGLLIVILLILLLMGKL